MLKKSGIILVVLLYLVTANGFALNLHFCGETIASVKINTPVKDCGMSSKCCKQTHLEVKVKDAHQLANASFTTQILALPVSVLKYNFEQKTLINISSPSVIAERAPPPQSVSACIKNCTFRI